MNILLVVAAGAIALFIASRTYAFWLGRVFRLDDRTPPPSETNADGVDFVKSPTQVVFAHHFASIAGAGPIVGPIIALAFGWGPAWLWIVLGGIFYGAVHDMSTMCVSLREGGRSIAEIARRTLGGTGYLLFLTFLLLVISIVNAIFLKLSAGALSSMYPVDALGAGARDLLTVVEKDGVSYGRIGGIATTSVIVMTIAAPVIGLLVARKRVAGLRIFAIGAAVCVIGVLAGFQWPVGVSPDAWLIILAVYVTIACLMPVWLLLQPRDFMNVQILYCGIALLLTAAVIGGLQGETMQLATSAIGEQQEAGKPFWPIMFITIACGAISGFHSLVATGTTIKQLPRETDCRRIGYNAMLLESLLAVLVLVAVGSQMDLPAYRATMDTSQGGGAILTFAVGCGSLFTNLGIPMPIGCVLGILIIEGFLVTTLDTSIRLARYLLDELFAAAGWRKGPVVGTLIAVALMLGFAFSKDAYDALWPYFGAGNQLIGALALTTVSIWLLRRRRTFWFAALPAAFMVVTALAALGMSVRTEAGRDDPAWLVVGAGVLLLALGGGFVVVAITTALRTGRETEAS